jgi:hypothetical protein
MDGTESKKDGQAGAAPAAEFAELKGVEIAEFPCRDNLGVAWDEEDGKDIAATFAEFGGRVKPPLVLAHDEAASASFAGQPALGWPTRVWMEGKKLLADIGRVPARLGELINKGAYKRISGSWWYDGRQAGIPEAKRRPVLRHIALLGAQTPEIKTLADVQALFGGKADLAVAEFSEEKGARVAEFADLAPATEAKPPENFKEAILMETTRERLQPIISAIHSRLWIIQEEHGRSDADVVAALKELAAELAKFLAAYEPSPGAHSPEEVAAAQMTAGAGGMAEPVVKPAEAAGSPQAGLAAPVAAAGGDRPTGEKPGAGKGPVAALSDAAKGAIATFVTRLTADGRLAPKHAPAIRAQAAACFVQGGEEALAAYLDDEDGLRKDKVVPIGETGKAGGAPETAGGAAEFADPAADAAAVAEFDRFGFGRSLGITRDEYVKARRQKQK